MVSEQELQLAQRQVDQLQAKLDKALEFRNDCLAEMLGSGGSPARLAKLTGMSRGRIYQLIEIHSIAR